MERLVSSDGPIVPFQTTRLVGRRVLVLSPHQDDETLGCGGAIAIHRQSGDPVKIVFLTDGAQADFRHEYVGQDYVGLREREARAAAEILGASDLEFWRLPDGLLPSSGAPLARLIELLAAYRPGLVYAPSPLEFHPDHRATAALVWTAVSQSPAEIDVAFFEVNRPFQANTLVDITSVVAQKRQACDAYVSQLANYPYGDCTLGLNRYRSLTVSPACEYAEGYFLLPGHEIAAAPIESFAPRQYRSAAPPPNRVPLASIIVRTRNRPALLREALASVRAQTQSDLEVIVVNDGGEDVRAVLDELRPQLDIRYQAHESPRGRAAAANTGLRMACGNYISFLDDDDILHPGHVGKLTAFLETTGAAAAYSDCEIGRYRWEGGALTLLGGRSLYKGIDFDLDRLHFGNYIPLMTVMFRRDLLTATDAFDEALDCLEDWDFLLRLATRAPFHRLAGITAEYRVLDAQRHDWARWWPVVYRKHEAFWTIDGVARAWPKLEASFEAREAALRDALVAVRADRDALQTELRLVRSSYPQRLADVLRRWLPSGLLGLPRRLAGALRGEASPGE